MMTPLPYQLTSEQQISQYKILKEKIDSFGLSVDECINQIKTRNEAIEEIKKKKKLLYTEVEKIKEEKVYCKAMFSIRGAKGYFFIIYNLIVGLLLLDNYFNGNISQVVFSFLKINLDNIGSVLFRFSIYGICLYIIWRILHINYLFRIKEWKSAKPLFERVKELEKDIEKLDKQIEDRENELKPYKENMEDRNKIGYITFEDTVELFVEDLKARLIEKKTAGKSETMYADLYAWIEHLYNVGYPEAAKYESILLLCEQDIYLTPKERKEYCAKRIQELNGYQYYQDYKIYEDAWKGVGLSMFRQNASSSNDLSEAEAWHAVTSGMMGDNGIDSTGM